MCLCCSVVRCMAATKASTLALLPASAYFHVERCALVIALVLKIKMKKKVRLKSNDRK